MEIFSKKTIKFLTTGKNLPVKANALKGYKNKILKSTPKILKYYSFYVKFHSLCVV